MNNHLKSAPITSWQTSKNTHFGNPNLSPDSSAHSIIVFTCEEHSIQSRALFWQIMTMIMILIERKKNGAVNINKLLWSWWRTVCAELLCQKVIDYFATSIYKLFYLTLKLKCSRKSILWFFYWRTSLIAKMHIYVSKKNLVILTVYLLMNIRKNL